MKRWVSCWMLLILSLIVTAVGTAQNRPNDKLIDLIKREHNKNVKKSTGTMAYQCFTDDDLARFRASGRAKKVVEGLKTDKEFIAVVAAIREMPEESRRELLAKARGTALPTWAQLGYIDPEGKGQTEAGQTAQLAISAAIVEAVQEMLQAGK
jgi:hypothetical protein